MYGFDIAEERHSNVIFCTKSGRKFLATGFILLLFLFSNNYGFKGSCGKNYTELFCTSHAGPPKC